MYCMHLIRVNICVIDRVDVVFTFVLKTKSFFFFFVIYEISLNIMKNRSRNAKNSKLIFDFDFLSFKWLTINN